MRFSKRGRRPVRRFPTQEDKYSQYIRDFPSVPPNRKKSHFTLTRDLTAAVLFALELGYVGVYRKEGGIDAGERSETKSASGFHHRVDPWSGFLEDGQKGDIDTVSPQSLSESCPPLGCARNVYASEAQSYHGKNQRNRPADSTDLYLCGTTG